MERHPCMGAKVNLRGNQCQQVLRIKAQGLRSPWPSLQVCRFQALPRGQSQTWTTGPVFHLGRARLHPHLLKPELLLQSHQLRHKLRYQLPLSQLLRVQAAPKVHLLQHPASNQLPKHWLQLHHLVLETVGCNFLFVQPHRQ